MNSKKVINSQRMIYDAQIKAFGDSPESTHNQLVEIQNLRFERLLSNINLDSENTIHDVGCGICDLYQYLNIQNSKLIYSGTDIVPAMKDLVNAKFPELEYHLRDIIEDKVEDTYDYVVLSGTFNLPGSIDRNVWLKFTRKMILSMYKMAKKGIAFNFLSKKADFYNPEMFYESVEDIFDFTVKNMSRHVLIDHAYPLYEFSCTVLKQESIREMYSHLTFDKYFKV